MSDIGFHLFDAAPGPGAFRARPMDICEIDSHPDSARIWATIKSMQDAGYDHAERDQEKAIEAAIEARDDEWSDLLDDLVLTVSAKRIPESKDGEDPAGWVVDVKADIISKSAAVPHATIIEALEPALDKLSERLMDEFDGLADQLAAVKARDQEDREAVLKIKAEVDTIAKAVKMPEYDRRVLRSGRPDDTIFKRMKKEDLVSLTAHVLARLYRRQPRS